MKKQTQSFSWLLWNCLLHVIFENPFSNPLQSRDFDINVYKSRLWFCKTIPEVACDKLIFAYVPCSQWKVRDLKLLKGLENHERIHKKYWLKCLAFQKNVSTSWHCPFKLSLETVLLVETCLTQITLSYSLKLWSYFFVFKQTGQLSSYPT
jgi:hypothetical protein